MRQMALQFTKMHGAGNDYVYLDGVGHRLPDDLPGLARRISDRHFGVGGDGLICILPPTVTDAHVRMRMFNSDGSEAEMCGNGVRCVAKYVHDHGLSDANPLRVETGRGVLDITLHLGRDGKVESATVDMGEPILAIEQIPADVRHLTPTAAANTFRLTEVAAPDGTPVSATLVSMGNPHAVVFARSAGEADLNLGPAIERHRAFPRKTNVHFVQVLAHGEVKVIHWERGTGPTLACGTGACAVCVAGALTGRTGREIITRLPGGDLRLRWDEATGHVYMTGPAVEVFSGQCNG